METNFKDDLPTYECFPRPEWRALFPALVAIAVTIVILGQFQTKWYWVVLPCVVLLLAGLSVCWWPLIEVKNKRVRERAMLFKRKFLTERITPFSEFEEIFCELHEADGTREYWVGLRRQRNILWIKSCGAERRFAEELAWKISCDTGIQLRGNPLSKEQLLTDYEKFRK